MPLQKPIFVTELNTVSIPFEKTNETGFRLFLGKGPSRQEYWRIFSKCVLHFPSALAPELGLLTTNLFWITVAE